MPQSLVELILSYLQLFVVSAGFVNSKKRFLVYRKVHFFNGGRLTGFLSFVKQKKRAERFVAYKRAEYKIKTCFVLLLGVSVSV